MNRPLRIALVSQEYPPETAKGGLGTQTHLKAHGLAALGHEIHVISRSLEGVASQRRDGSVNVIRVPGRERTLALHTEVADWLTYSAEVAGALQSLNQRGALDVVDFPEWAAEGYVHLVNRTEWNWIPTVIQLHGPLVMLAHTVGWPDRSSEFFRVGTHMEHTCLRLADAVFSSSRCSADWCARHYGLNADAIPVLHTGVDTCSFAPQSVPKAEQPTIVFVGRLARSKGVELLVDAAGRIAPEFPGLQLRLIGHGDPALLSALKIRAAAAGLEHGLRMPGHVDHLHLPMELSRAHLFASPSRYEGGPGFVCLEAMACELPVIACDGSGVAEVVRHGETGLLIPPDDLDALTSALRALLGDAQRRQTLGQQARRFVVAQADSRLCLSRLEQFYAAAATLGRPPTPRP
jgi:glycosyltransferase involved in cell wall biosynthesis